MTESEEERLGRPAAPAPSVSWRHASADAVEAETLVLLVPVHGAPDPLVGAVLATLGVAALDELPGVRELAAAHGDTWRMPTLGRMPAREVLFAWYGAEPDERQAIAEAAQVAGRLTATRTPVAIVLHDGTRGALDAVLDGIHSGRRMACGGSGADLGASAPGEILLVSRELPPADLDERAERAAVVAAALGRACDLVAAPPNVLGPASFAAIAVEVARAVGAEARVWSVEELHDGRFAGLLEVGKASAEPPALVELTYRGAGADAPSLALVGKGVTFDSGGYDIKPIGEMLTMKRDMAGAAAVLGAVEAAARLRLPVNVVGLLAIAENVIAGNALRPGDVIVHRNGVTTEVTNPDAEGRLVLADALAYAAESQPAAIVEVSTLVGPPLGADLWALLASDDALADELLAAGRAACDPGWRLPLWRRYRRHIATPAADQRNSTQSLTYPIAVISSALFLDRFVPATIPWAHLDIAVTALRDGGTASPAWPAGATGSPVRALVRWLQASSRAGRPT